MLWYYARNGQRFGPVEEAEIQRLVESRQLSGSDLVWKPGLPEWRPAGQVPDLASFFQAAAPAPPPPPPTAPADFSPYAPPAAPLTSPPLYPAPMFGAVTTREHASFGARFLALLIDQILLGCVGGLLVFFVGFAQIAGSGGSGADMTGVQWITNAISILIGWLYYAGLESSSQMGTLGKKILGLKVTDLEGQRIDFGRATGRHFGKILSAIPLGLGFFMMLADEKKQTWHDKMAGCLVVKER